MGTFTSFKKAYDALKDSTMVGLAKVNSEFKKDLDIAIVKATNHVERPPKERHVRKIFIATSAIRPRADVTYCIHALSRRLAKTSSWIVAIKTLIVFHRTLREGDPTFREELLNYSHRGHVLQISNFKDDSSPLAWDCSTWVRTYALFLEERLECFRVLKYDIEAERLTKSLPGVSKMHSRTRVLSSEQLLEQLPALQQLLYRLIGCLPEGAAYHNFLVQYALALVLKESFKIYCAINDGIINLVDMLKLLISTKELADRSGSRKELSVPNTWTEYIKEAPQTGSLSNRRMEYEETSEEPEQAALEESEQQEVEEAEDKETLVDTQQEPEPETEPKEEEEVPPLISINQTEDLLGLNEINPKAAELEESNALALAIVPPGNNPVSSGWDLSAIGNTSGWELALVTTPSNNSTSYVTERKLAGGFDKLLLDSLYEDDASRRQLQLQNAGYNTRAGYGYEMTVQNPFDQRQDPFIVSNSIAPPTNVQMTLMHQQQQQQQQQQQNMITMTPHHYLPQYPQQQMPYMGYSNPFGDPFTYQQNATPPQGNHSLI
ncbi:unnamed protein product [Camellia sinensis]